jgi:hypothetical protein
MSFSNAGAGDVWQHKPLKADSQASMVNAFLNDLEQVRISIFKADALSQPLLMYGPGSCIAVTC